MPSPTPTWTPAVPRSACCSSRSATPYAMRWSAAAATSHDLTLSQYITLKKLHFGTAARTNWRRPPNSTRRDDPPARPPRIGRVAAARSPPFRPPRAAHRAHPRGRAIWPELKPAPNACANARSPNSTPGSASNSCACSNTCTPTSPATNASHDSFPASFVRLSTALATALLAACASTGGLAPPNTPIQADAIAAQRALSGARLAPAQWPQERWWTALGDPQLDALIEEGLAGSPSIDAADALPQGHRQGRPRRRAAQAR